MSAWGSSLGMSTKLMRSDTTEEERDSAVVALVSKGNLRRRTVIDRRESLATRSFAISTAETKCPAAVEGIKISVSIFFNKSFLLPALSLGSPYLTFHTRVFIDMHFMNLKKRKIIQFRPLTNYCN